MASIESAIRAMLIRSTLLSASSPVDVPDARVTHGYRLQSSILPAVTFEVASTALATIGAMRESELTVTCICDTTVDASALVDYIEASVLDTGTYDTIDIHALVVRSKTVAAPTAGLGDEQEPATATLTVTVYWEP
jgi:hypothetical protein